MAKAAVMEEQVLEPGRRPDIEHELSDTYHVDWKYVSGVGTHLFDEVKSLHNQARFDPIDPKTVDLYTESVKRGDVFPAVLAYRPSPRARYVMIDGNHRLLSHIAADQTPLDLYEIDRDTNPLTIALLTFSMNTRHGKPTSEEERVHHAIYLVDNGASIDNAAAAVSIAPRTLKKALSRAKADERADSVDLKRNEWDALNVTVKTRLLNISTDEGFRAAANLAFLAKLDANEVFELVAQMNTSGKSGRKQEAIVKAHRELHQQRIQAGGGGVLSGGHRKPRGAKQRVSMAIGQCLALPDDYDVIVKAYAIPERIDAAKRMREASAKLTTLADLLAPLKR